MRKTILAMALALLLPVLTGFGSGQGTVRIATKPMTEQYILGAMMKKLIEQDTDLKVDVISGIAGGTSNIMPAILKSEFDFYPEYTGTGWNVALHKNSIYHEDMFNQLKEGYQKLGLSWVGLPGFNNTFGLAVRKEIADKYGLETYSDLAPIADKLVFGAEYDFYERGDGFKALCDTYKLKFKDTKDMDIGLKYAAINQGDIDVMNIFTTDGQLSVADVKILQDDRGLYPSYSCGFVTRNEILEKHPELNSVFSRISGKISDAEMARMNYLVEGEGMEPEDVAYEFLKDKNIIQ